MKYLEFVAKKNVMMERMLKRLQVQLQDQEEKDDLVVAAAFGGFEQM